MTRFVQGLIAGVLLLFLGLAANAYFPHQAIVAAIFAVGVTIAILALRHLITCLQSDDLPLHHGQEIELLLLRFPGLVFSGFILAYVITVVARNLANYRNAQAASLGRLPDVGYELIPPLPHSLEIVPHLIVLTNIGLAVLTVLLPLLYPSEKRRIYTVNILARALNVLALGHVVRALLYLSTTLPAPASHCQPDSPLFVPPQNLTEVFFKFFPRGCGDLVFSGHVLTACTAVMTIRRYIPSLLPEHAPLITSLSTLPLIISARSHYTLDVLAACFAAPGVWLGYSHIFPDDPLPSTMATVVV